MPPKPGIGQKALITERLGAFWEGRWRELFDSAMVAARRAVCPLSYTCSDQDPDAIRLSRSRSRCKVGEWSRGLACLTAGELARPSEVMVPERARPWLAASNLVALSKLNGDVRPMAIGEVLPHILARALCISLRPAMVSYFLPCNQLGAGTSVGAEILTHSFRSALATHPTGALEWVGLEVLAHKCRFWEREGKEVEWALPLGMHRVDEGLTVVGAPIGEEVWEVVWLRERLRQLHAPLPWLPLLDHPQMASHLLAIAVSARPMYLARTMPPRPEARQRQLAVEELQALRRLARDDATLARFTSLQGPGAGAWVSAVPAHSDLTFTAAEWGIAAAIRLCLPIQQLQVAGRCVCVAAREWERRKTSDYAPLLARNRGVQFTPLIVETWGCIGGRFQWWLRQQGVAHVGLAVSQGACREDDSVFSAYLLGSLKALIGVALQRAQARVILLRAASSMGGINVDLVDRERDDVDVEGGALWVEATYMVDTLM
ncbi:unnamed protein product [Closterium sp. NIES-65]|nr:unnamed protein product [Closterium sp. NIES-65]